MMPKRANPHEMARDAAFRPPGRSPATGPGLVCKACGAEQMIAIPIFDLMVESDESEGLFGLPVALVCLACHAQWVHWTEWRAQEASQEDRGDG